MLPEIVCAVAVLMTLRHVLELLERNAELAQQVLYLSFRVRRLRELSKKLIVSSDAWRMLGRRRPSARMRIALCYPRKSALSSAASQTAGEGAGAGTVSCISSCTDARSRSIARSTSSISSGGIMHNERRLRPRADAGARTGVCGSPDSSSGGESNFSARRCHKQGETSRSESASSSG
jgi:hypothetical protein